ncbi:MAG: hypothetical protein KTR31_02455 [Myxococcales bacterium]|nr:hypothetical protein [Myxococcales bacterium]
MTLLLLGTVAQAADVVSGANMVGMGGVGVAAPTDNAGITLNPGTLGLERRYDFHAHFRLGPSAGLQWGATAMDGRTSKRVSAGFAYSGDRFDAPLTDNDLPGWAEPDEEILNRKRFHDLAGAIAVPVLDRKLSFGVGVTYSLFDHDQQGNGRQLDVHGGAAVRPVKALTVGLSARNLVPSDNVLDRPLEVLGGVSVIDEDNLAAEINVGRSWAPGAPTPWTVAGGVEKVLGQTQLRGGARWVGPERRSFGTLGIGYTDTSGGIEYSLSVPLNGDVSLGGTLHQVSIRFSAPKPIEPM